MNEDDNDSDSDSHNDDAPSFAMILQGLQHPVHRTNQPDPRTLRLAAVASAIVDVLDGGAPTAAQVYAKAVTALEGTLENNNNNNNDNNNASNDNTTAAAVRTNNQVALLELWCATLPHVTPVVIVAASLPVTSRVLRTLVVEAALDDNVAELLLRWTCRAAVALLQTLPPSTDDALTQQCLRGTLLMAWNDRRSKVRKAAQQGLLQLVLSNVLEQGRHIHPILVKTTTAAVHSVLVKAARIKDLYNGNINSINNNEQWQTLLRVLPFVERAIWSLNYRQLATDTMEFLTLLLQLPPQSSMSTEDFVAVTKRQQSTPKLLTMQALLSLVLVLLRESEAHESDQQQQRHTWSSQEFAPRVLASLLQIPSSHWRMLAMNDNNNNNNNNRGDSGDEEDSVVEQTQIVLGQVVVASCRRLLLIQNNKDNNHSQLAGKLLPLAVQLVLNLARPTTTSYHHHQEATPTVAATLLQELTQLFRADLPRWLAGTTTTTTSVERQQAIVDTVRAARRLLDHDDDSINSNENATFRSAWSVALKCFVVLLPQLHAVLETSIPGNKNDPASSLVTDCVEQLIALHRDDHARDARLVEDALSTLIQAVGLETGWSWIAWQPASSSSPPAPQSIAKERAWILSVLKAAASTVQPVPPRLAFFQSHVLEMARICDKLAVAAEAGKGSRKHASLLYHRQVVVDLWSLFPCFCRSPSDLAESLPSLTATLARALEDKRYPELLAFICQGCTTLVKDLEANGSLELESTSEDVAAVAAAAVKLLPVMFKFVSDAHAAVSAAKKVSTEGSMDCVTEEPKLDGKAGSNNNCADDYQQLQSVTMAISSMARLAPSEFLHGLFKKLMHRLLEEVQAEHGGDRERICALLTLSQALVASKVLEEENSSIVFLFRALQPLIRNDEHGPRVQKRAYKVLAEICEQHHEFVVEPERLKELLALLTGTIMTSQISARSMRLKCMNLIVDGLDETNSELLKEIHKVTAEVLLCLKDSNGKSRDAAYQLLISLASKGDVMGFVQVVVAALAAKTSHMRSAVVMALSRIVFEKAWDSEPLQFLLPNLLQTVIVLIDEGSREVVKSVVGFIRICVSAIPPDKLKPLLPELLGTLLKSNHTKSRFRAKIKIILKKLVKHFGYEALMPHVPSTETRLLTHMRKLDEREKRRKKATKGERMSQVNNFDEMVDSDEEDSDDGKTFMTGATGFSQFTGKTRSSSAKSVASKRSRFTASGSVASGKSKTDAKPKIRLPDETDGEVFDMLGAKMAKRVHFMDNDNDDSDSDDEVMVFNDDGKLVVLDDEHDKAKSEDVEELQDSNKRRRISKLEAAKVARNERSSKKQGQHKTPGPGSAYKSKKAGGDVKKKGQKYEPYAYVPLDGRSYSKKNRKTAVEQMSSVVRQGKRKR